jgi:hypothetical protein
MKWKIFIFFGSIESSDVEKWVLEATITPVNQSDKLFPLVAIIVKAGRIKEC